MVHNVILIGAGQLGSRHLQGLMKSTLPLRIEVVEPSPENSRVAYERAKQILAAGKELVFHESIEEVTCDEAGLAIVATNSDVRADVVTQLAGRVSVKSLLLEKVAYQSADTFERQIALFNGLKMKVWVNCPRRIYDFYRLLAEELKDSDRISVSVTGSNWGLGCNALHFIDLFGFLTSSNDIRVDYTALDREIRESKRRGFVEFTGRMGFSGSRGVLHLSSLNYSELPVIIEIASDKVRRIISEVQGYVVTYRGSEGFRPEIAVTRFPFQSELTDRVAEEILLTGSCGLTGIEESYIHHSLLLPLFNTHLYSLRGAQPVNCPIT